LGTLIQVMSVMNFHRFRYLTFDCYGTLIDWESGILAALRPVLAAHNKTITDEALLELYAEVETELERGDYRPYCDILQEAVPDIGERLGFTATYQEELV